MEIAGSFGDLGTLLPIAVGMVVLNGLDPLGVFLTIGLFTSWQEPIFVLLCRYSR